MPLETPRIVQNLREMLLIPSPTGFTTRAMTWLEAELKAIGATPVLTRKGAMTWTLPGDSAATQASAAPRAIAAHMDTLGAMVKEVKFNLPPIAKEEKNASSETQKGQAEMRRAKKLERKVNQIGTVILDLFSKYDDQMKTIVEAHDRYLTYSNSMNEIHQQGKNQQIRTVVRLSLKIYPYGSDSLAL